jgi:hypothetical protein
VKRDKSTNRWFRFSCRGVAGRELAAERGQPISGRRGAAGSHSALSGLAGNVNENGTTRLVGAAKALGADIPATLLGRADEVIE